MRSPASLADRARAHRAVVARRYAGAADDPAPAGLSLRPLLGAFDLPSPPAALAPTCDRYVSGWFDLLGSGWRPFTRPGSEGLDWHVDLLSGHRWDPSTWHAEIDRAPGPGIDVKLPWELGRLQHLPQLALAYRHATGGGPGLATPETYRGAIEVHLVDFLAHNPPGRGVQWGCAMDVGIRVANVLLALDVLASGGSALSPGVQRLVVESVYAHAAFIVANLEWTRAARTNHYLADLCGLAWAAAHLEGSHRSDSWLCLAARELQAETHRQFDRDGAGTEGSTSYHRLSAEMVVWTTAMLLSLPDERVRSLQPRAEDLADVPLSLRGQPPTGDDVVMSPGHLRMVARMPALTKAMTFSGSTVALIGDNDSGRFVKPTPAFRPRTVGEMVATYRNLDGYHLLGVDDVYWWEDPTDHGHLIDAVEGLFGTPGTTADGVLVQSYAVGRPPTRPGRASLSVRIGGERPQVAGDARQRTVIVPGGDDLLDGLETEAFVPFGVYVWRSRRLFLAVRCESLGQEGLAGHDHRDQLAVELHIDGRPWFRDPGTVTYTRDPDLRNAYRSAAAHAGPGGTEAEDWGTAGGLFQLGGLAATGVPLWYGPTGFVGERRGPEGRATRSVELLPNGIEIVDILPGGSPADVELRDPPPASVPFSPGYGWQERA